MATRASTDTPADENTALARAAADEPRPTAGKTVALVDAHIHTYFHSGVDGAPDPITGEPQAIEERYIDAVQEAAKAADIRLTVRSS